MAGGLPPPPTKAADGGFAWTSWYNQLYKMLSTTGSVAWSLIDKAGSSIADLANKNHNLLTSMQGGTTNEYYHFTAAEHTNLAAVPTAANIITTTNYATNNIVDTTVKTKAGAIVVGDIPAGTWAIYKDTSGGTLKLYANDGGVLKSVALV